MTELLRRDSKVERGRNKKEVGNFPPNVCAVNAHGDLFADVHRMLGFYATSRHQCTFSL